MIYFFSALNIKRFFRTLKEIGLLRAVIVLFIALYLYFVICGSIIDDKKVIFIVIAFILSILSIHLNRKDKNFLKKAIKNHQILFLSQYIFILLPIFISLLISEKFLISAILLISIIIIAYLNFTSNFKRNFKTLNFRFINPLNFEWNSGFRKNGILMGLIYIIAFVFPEYELVIVAPVIIWAFFVTSFYMISESEMMVVGFQLNPIKFIRNKVLRSLQLFHILMFPIYAEYLILFYSHWYLLLFSILATSLLISFSILTKYAAFQPNESLKGNVIHIVLFSLCFVKPFLFPIPVVMLIRNYFKSVNNMKNYLYVRD